MVESLAIKETVMDKEESSKQGRKIDGINADAEVNLENVYNLNMAHKETVLSMQDVIDVDVKEVAEEMVEEESSKQGRKIDGINAYAKINLENVYNLNMAHKETVLSMQDVTDVDVKEVAEEMVEVITTIKIIVDEVSTAGGELNAANEEPVSAAPTNITTVQPSEATKIIVDIATNPKAKGIVFHNKEESTTRTASLKSQVKDKGKAKLVEKPKIQKSRKAQIAIDEEVARRIEAEWNADIKDNVDWNKVVE
nr:hypothetical protein [Tanacetum cinerariifolium]